MTSTKLAAVAVRAVLLAVCAACAGAPPTPAAPPGPDPLASFATVAKVLQHPRCLSCHPAGDAPTQGDDVRPHSQEVVRGPEGRGVAGLACATCHGKANLPDSYGPGQPPGTPTEWKMPPPGNKMVFAGLTAKALCEQVKDPARNGGKTLPQLVEHATKDPIVLWGWKPGAGRTPVDTPHPVFAVAFAAWATQGAPCPP